MYIRERYFVFLIIPAALIILMAGCKQDANPKTIFELLEGNQTGIDFTNKLTPTAQFNMFKYMYFYNGAGVGAGDFNNDGLIDLFFASNQGQCKLYLNAGNLKFRDVTKEAAVPDDGGWSTGVSVVDINNDGLLDIYICRVSKYENLKGRNLLLVCKTVNKDGVPVFEERAAEYGLDFSGFSTQAAFMDYDLDGDLDMFLLNHTVHHNGTFGPRKNFLGTYDENSGDRFYRNDNGYYIDVTKETGINSSVNGYGLGIAVADINLDGYPDIYIGNDFHENDYLYINQKNGTFKEDLQQCIMHTSQFSMGVDVADVNNDALPEIISLDMLPSDPYILKRSLGEDAYDIFKYKIGIGYNYQYARNNLQVNRGNGMFSETGLYSGIFATDWSWSALWMDFDNDGMKDLFISNGIPKRLNDIDYVNYVSSEEIQRKINTDSLEENEMAVIDKFPQIKLPNKFYRNKGDFVFTDEERAIKNDKPTFSNGAVYADLDNDGDLDVVVSNIDDPAMIYRNTTNDGHKSASFFDIRLKGAAGNINATGSKAIVFAGSSISTYEKYPVKGFLSSMEIPMHIGTGKEKADSIILIWPDNSYQSITTVADSGVITLNYHKGLPAFNYDEVVHRGKSDLRPMTDITTETELGYLHKENNFNEFNREQLIPHELSTEGPALATGDINGDGYDDVFIGSSKRNKSAVFMQTGKGKFSRMFQPDIDNDSTYEDVAACFIDVNKDGFPDLVVASGGNEYYGHEPYQMPRIYLNNGKGIFRKKNDAFDSLYITASCIVPCDFNNDGSVDLFIGGRAVPFEYGQVPNSYMMENDGTGKFRDATALFNKELFQIGFVTDAIWCDIDKDGDSDLILSLEWDGIIAFINEKGQFTKKYLTDKKGWWNFILPFDADGDGDIDLIAGNLGENSRLKASDKEPVTLYFNDFDDNGKKEQVLTYYVNGREIPFANMMELEKQIPSLKKKFLYAEGFARASLNDLFTAEKLSKSDILTANYFKNSILLNDGNMKFTVIPLPWQAQLSSYRDALVINANNDSLPDMLLGGNFYENNIQMGRYDADFGTILVNKGGGRFTCENINGLEIKGEVRHIRKIHIGKREAFVLARNNDSCRVISYK